MKHAAKNRDKLLGDLLTEAPTTLTAEDVIELEIVRNQITQWTFNVSHYVEPTKSVTLSVGSDPLQQLSLGRFGY